MVAMRQPLLQDFEPVPTRPNARSFSADSVGVGAGGPVGELLADLDSRLTEDEYAYWLLPPEPRSALEKMVHCLSLGAGVIALTGGASLLWLIL